MTECGWNENPILAAPLTPKANHSSDPGSCTESPRQYDVPEAVDRADVTFVFSINKYEIDGIGESCFQVVELGKRGAKVPFGHGKHVKQAGGTVLTGI